MQPLPNAISSSIADPVLDTDATGIFKFERRNSENYGSIVDMEEKRPYDNPGVKGDGKSKTQAFQSVSYRKDLIEEESILGNELCSVLDLSIQGKPHPTHRELEKSMSLFHTVALAIGQIIGSGIFISPNVIVQNVGSMGLSLIMWALGGVLSTCAMMCFGELGAMYPKSGGECQYLKITYGKLAAFSNLWVLMIVNSMGAAVVGLTFATYFLSIFLDDTTEHFSLYTKVVAALALVTVIGICIYETKTGLWIQSTFMILKVLALLFLVSLAVVFLAKGRFENLKHGFTGTNMDVKDWSNALLSSMWAYNGWNSIGIVASEVNNPKKNLPRALMITGVSVTSVYIIINVAYHTLMSTQDLVKSQSIAVVAGEIFFAEYGEGAVRFGQYFFAVSVALSTFGSLLAMCLVSSRLPYAGALENMLPKCFGLVSKGRKTPVISILFIGTTSFCCIWPSNIGALINYAMYLSWLFWGLCFAAVIVLRWKLPDVPRPFKVPLFIPIIAILTSLYLIIGPFYASPLSSGTWILVTLASVPVYYGYVDKRQQCDAWMGSLNKRLSWYFKADVSG